MASLANQTISSTYDGLIKTSSDNAVGVSGVQLLQDGSGNDLALSVGRSGNGVTITGNLAVDTNTLYVDASNNRVGVGTASPASKLNLYDSTDSDMAIRIQNSPSNFYVGVDNTTGSRFIGSSGSAAYIGTTTSSPIEFATANTVRATIDSSGNVGINCSPNSKLQVVGAVQDQIRFGSNTSVYTDLWMGTGYTVFDSIGGNSGAFDFRDDGTSRMFIDSSGNVGIGTSSPSSSGGYAKTLQVEDSNSASISVSRTGATACSIEIGSYSGANLIDSIGSGIPLRFAVDGAERMRITSGGDVQIGAQTVGAGSLSTHLPLGGGILITNNTLPYIRCYSLSGSFPDIFQVANNGDVTSATGSYGTISDIRLKENIVPATSKLQDILSLEVKNYNFIGKEDKQIGFIAQEFEQVFPSLVNTEDTRQYDDDGNVISGYEDLKSVKVGMDFAILVKAIQEQQEIINDLKARIETLENN